MNPASSAVVKNGRWGPQPTARSVRRADCRRLVDAGARDVPDERPAKSGSTGDLGTDDVDGMSNLGVFGLATMGANLARNAAPHGYDVAVYNRHVERTDALIGRFGDEGMLTPAGDLPAFVALLRRARIIVIMIAAGPAIDGVVDDLKPLLEAGDTVVDAGNCLFPIPSCASGALPCAASLPRHGHVGQRGGRTARAEPDAARRSRGVRSPRAHPREAGRGRRRRALLCVRRVRGSGPLH